MNIEHRLCRPRHPQTNGMMERFNGRISEVVSQTRFNSAAELDATFDSYLKAYNHLIPQRVLDHLSPVQALKKWQAEKPDLFLKRVDNQPGLDSYSAISWPTFIDLYPPLPILAAPALELLCPVIRSVL
jgi:hypothetical protein